MALEYRSKLPDDIPSALPVFRLRAQEGYPAAGASLAELAKRLGLRGRPHELCLSDDWTMHQEGLWELGTHSKSGAVVARHREKYQHPGDHPFKMSDDDALGAAKAFLERIELVPLDEVGPARVTHLRAAGGGPDDREFKETLIDAGVIVGRSLKEVAVSGPGGAVMVNVGNDAEVVGLRSIWRPIEDVADEARVLKPDVAHEAMEQIARNVSGDVTITKSEFGYFEQGILESQTFLQPAYMFVYVVTDDEVSYKSAEVVAALEKPLEPLLGEKRFPAARQPKRELPPDRVG